MYLNSMSMVVRYNYVFINRRLAGKNISATEYYALMYLMDKTDISQEQIANYFQIDKGSISKTIRTLEEKGFLVRETNPENRRANLIRLTDLGRKQFSEDRHVLDVWHEAMMKGITKTEFRQFVKTLEKMEENSKKALDLNE